MATKSTDRWHEKCDAVDGGARLATELVGERIDPERHALASDVKAATAHGLRLTPTEGGFRATVTLDV